MRHFGLARPARSGQIPGTMKLIRFALAGLLAAGACTKTSDGGSEKALELLTKRIEKLEQEQKQFSEVAEFVKPIMEQQKAQEEQQASQDPDPATRFSIDVAGDATDGPATAAVTIIEAFDFA